MTSTATTLNGATSTGMPHAPTVSTPSQARAPAAAAAAAPTTTAAGDHGRNTPISATAVGIEFEIITACTPPVMRRLTTTPASAPMTAAIAVRRE
jgi:hypothetical protein